LIEDERAPHREEFAIRWSDLDANRHVRNTVYSELATHTRFRWLEASGYPQARFEEARFGPVMFREVIRYRRELVFGDRASVDVRAAGLSDNGSHWLVRQEVSREDGKTAAVLLIEGAWIHLDTRRLVHPGDELVAILCSLPRTRDFAPLKSMLRAADRGSRA
jgi:acyl-CoA thioester hydrolase